YYPGCLLCTYDVSENHYDSSNESVWFEEAVLQVRSYGAQAFPPIKWVIVVIANRAEHKDAKTFAQSRKAGVVFDAKQVLKFDYDLEKCVTKAKADRHPFAYDPGHQPDRRWLIAEKLLGMK